MVYNTVNVLCGLHVQGIFKIGALSTCLDVRPLLHLIFLGVHKGHIPHPVVFRRPFSCWGSKTEDRKSWKYSFNDSK